MLEVTVIFKLLLIREAPAMTVTEQHRIDKRRATNTANTSQVNIVATDKSITQLSPKLDTSTLFLFRCMQYRITTHSKFFI